MSWNRLFEILENSLCTNKKIRQGLPLTDDDVYPVQGEPNTYILEIPESMQPCTDFVIRNKSTTKTLKFTINDTEVVLDPAPTTDAPFGEYIWDDCHGDFSEVELVSEDLSFVAYVRG